MVHLYSDLFWIERASVKYMQFSNIDTQNAIFVETGFGICIDQ